MPSRKFVPTLTHIKEQSLQSHDVGSGCLGRGGAAAEKKAVVVFWAVSDKNRIKRKRVEFAFLWAFKLRLELV